MKLLKNSRIFSIVILFIGVVAFSTSCSSDESENNFSTDSASESLVTSKEFKKLNRGLVDFGYQIKSNYSKLSDTDKKKVINILNEAKEGANSEREIWVSFQELSSIMNIDFSACASELNVSTTEMRSYNEQNGISNKEYAIAVNKYSTVPRVRSSSEMSTADCISACAAVAALCVVLSGGGASPACTIAFAACCLAC